MRIDLEAELDKIATLLEQAQKKAAYWSDEAKRLTGAKDFCEHLMALSEKPESAPTPGAGFDDDDAPLPVPALVGAGANGSHP